jgi:glycosyltransferase involved in cell wall biosynthesis
LLTNEISPYRIPLYDAMGRTPEWDFRVFTCVDREAGRQWDLERDLSFHHQRSFSFSYLARRRRTSVAAFDAQAQIHVPVGHFLDLCRFRPDVVISAEFGFRTLTAAAYATLFRAKLVVWWEGTCHTSRSCTRGQRLLRRLLHRRPHAYVCNGRESRRYLEMLGVPPGKVFEVGQAVDAGRLQPSWTAAEREACRRELGISGLCYLYTGRLIPLKGIDRLLDAWRQFTRQAGVEATLLLVGDGALRGSLEEQAARAGLQNVVFHGFVQPSQMPRIYGAADFYVLPSLEDCWSLAVEEAMASGLPVIDSRYNGGSELIVEGENGWVADPVDVADLAGKLSAAWEARDRRKAIGRCAQRAVQRMSIDNVVARLRAAVEEVGP